MSRREGLLSAGLVFLVAIAVRAWAATVITFPTPEDVAYYFGVARNLVEGRGLTTEAIWSFQTPPLSFPRPAFEVWRPLPSLLSAIPMAIFGTTFRAAQLSSIVVGSLVCVLAWRLAADVAMERSLPRGRARTLALGTGLTTAVYLPLVLSSVQPDSTILFTAIALGACLIMSRLTRAGTDGTHGFGWQAVLRRSSPLLALGLLIGLAALTRNEAIWLALTWALVAWRISARTRERPTTSARLGAWLRLIAVPAVISILVFAPWAFRDWLEFGSPFPGQAITNALSLDGRDIFAWQELPTLERYLDAGLGRLVELRWIGLVHNAVTVLLFLGVPLSIIGLIGLPGTARTPGLRPLLLFSILTFITTTLLFPVATTWGTFMHAAGAVHVLLVTSSLLVLDRLLARVGVLRGWTRPVAWLGPAFAIAGSLLFSSVLLPADGAAGPVSRLRYAALVKSLEAAGAPLSAEPGPVITDFPIWFAEETRHTALALPNEPPSSILDLARNFDPPARLVVIVARNDGLWPGAILAGEPGSECFVPLPLADPPDAPGILDSVVAFRIRCP